MCLIGSPYLASGFACRQVETDGVVGILQSKAICRERVRGVRAPRHPVRPSWQVA